MEAVAKTKYLKGSPRKARLVIDMIRGQNVSRALSILKFTEKRAAEPIAQCLNSAIANATYSAEKQNIAIDPDDLWVNLCYVDMGPTKGRKRMRPAPQGRAYREQRHYCHITIQVTSEEKPRTEEQIRLEGLRDERIAARKVANAKIKAETPVVTKEKKADKVEKTPVVVVAEEVVDTPVIETVATDEAVVETVETEVATQADSVEENKSEIDAEISAAHETSTHTTAEENAAKPVDEVMEKTNEDLEKQ